MLSVSYFLKGGQSTWEHFEAFCDCGVVTMGAAIVGVICDCGVVTMGPAVVGVIGGTCSLLA